MIDSGAFNGLDNLQYLNLQYNKIKSIHPDSLLPMLQLNLFELLEKGLETLPKGLLRAQRNLEVLKISLQKVKFIDKTLFENNIKLLSVSLKDIRINTQSEEDGKQSPYIPEGIFHTLVDLKNISFSLIPGGPHQALSRHQPGVAPQFLCRIG